MPKSSALIAIAAGAGLFALGCAVAGAVGGQLWGGLGGAAGFGLLAWVCLRGGGGETGRIVAGGDPREQEIDVLAMAVCDGVLTVVLGVWLIAALATDGPAWMPGGLLLVSAVTYVVAIEVLRRRI
ncbi:hypothetical protein [Streptomyces sp. NPDC047108]|uniref:hypothetical protein n=1 Tax=Streptomyces sp. NPDC047108 TaxID=3155025 RepID=UPI0033F88AF0